MVHDIVRSHSVEQCTRLPPNYRFTVHKGHGTVKSDETSSPYSLSSLDSVELSPSMAAPVHPGSLVVVTGVNGHVASITALRLLEHGYRVRGTVRVLKSASFVQKSLARFGDKLEVVEVGSDISKARVFDAAVQGAYICVLGIIAQVG